MNIVVDTNSETANVSLEDAENFNTFAVRAVGPEAAFGAAVTQVGRYDGTHVFVSTDALKSLAGPLGQDPAWLEKLSSMLNYAEKKGWLDEDGAIQAHVER
jgi:hypothetical protein